MAPISLQTATVPRDSEFLQLVLERMSFLDGLRARAMFGGHGIYQDDHIFALVLDDRLYLKADAVNRSTFEAKGLPPFTYTAAGRTVVVSYFEAPAEVFEDSEAMRHWVAVAYAAALRAGDRKTTASPRQTPQRKG